MVTSAHEGMHRIFQERPEILSPVFGVLGIAFPEKAAVYAIGTDVTEARPLARHIDTVLRIGPSDGEDFLLAVEAQERRDTKKESSWPYYISHLQAKYGLPPGGAEATGLPLSPGHGPRPGHGGRATR
jgi:hypothetical protein